LVRIINYLYFGYLKIVTSLANKLLYKRIKSGEQIQYISRISWFLKIYMNLDFSVDFAQYASLLINAFSYEKIGELVFFYPK